MLGSCSFKTIGEIVLWSTLRRKKLSAIVGLNNLCLLTLRILGDAILLRGLKWTGNMVMNQLFNRDIPSLASLACRVLSWNILTVIISSYHLFFFLKKIRTSTQQVVFSYSLTKNIILFHFSWGRLCYLVRLLSLTLHHRCLWLLWNVLPLFILLNLFESFSVLHLASRYPFFFNEFFFFECLLFS